MECAAETALKIEMQFRESLDPKPTEDMAVQMAVLLYLEDRKSQHLRDSTISKLTTILDKQFANWCHGNGLHLLRQITLPHLQMWR